MTDNHEPKAGKRELFLIGAALLAALVLFLWNQIRFSSPAAVVEISVDGTVVQTLDLSLDQELEIPGTNGGSNYLIIQGGEVWVSDATCPDKLCIRQGKISHDGEMIVCLPNRMIAKILGETD